MYERYHAYSRLLSVLNHTLPDTVVEPDLLPKHVVELAAQYIDWAADHLSGAEWRIGEGAPFRPWPLIENALNLLRALELIYLAKDLHQTYEYERLVTIIRILEDTSLAIPYPDPIFQVKDNHEETEYVELQEELEEELPL